MKTIRQISSKKTGKTDRERKVLIGLVEHYLETGKPVGSHTLKEVGFADLSSATIRNYFAHLEQEGFLTQQHSSGGRVPTDKAFHFYAKTCLELSQINIETEDQDQILSSLRTTETRAISAFLQQSAEELAKITETAVFLSAPRFEQDFITSIKLIALDSTRCLCILITDFGEVKPEVLYVSQKMSMFTSKRIESYFNWRITGQHRPSLSKEEEEVAANLYSEIMLRYIVTYSQFGNEELYRTGFSKLLSYPEFRDPILLANSLSLFENNVGMNLLLKECTKFNSLKFWLCEDLKQYTPLGSPQCAVLASPYHINKQPIGAVGLLGPLRIPYKTLFTKLHQFAESISDALTNNLYKFKITARKPQHKRLAQEELALIGETQRLLIEDNYSARSIPDQDNLNPSSRRK